MSANTEFYSNDHFKEWMDIQSTPRSALLIEDSVNETNLIVHMSKDFRIKWDIAHNGESALRMIATKGRYQLVILDLILGTHPDGVDLFRDIKKICPTCPVLVLSGHISNDIILRITNIGFAMFAQKPNVFDSDFFEQLFMVLGIPKIVPVPEPQKTTECGEHI